MHVHAQSHDFTTASDGPLFVQIWHHDTSPQAVVEMGRVIDSCRPRVILIITDAGASMPSAEARQAIADIMVGWRGQVEASALVHEGTGFAAAAVRGVVSSLNLLAGHPFPYRVFGSVEQALGWFAELSVLPKASAARAGEALVDIRTRRSLVPR